MTILVLSLSQLKDPFDEKRMEEEEGKMEGGEGGKEEKDKEEGLRSFSFFKQYAVTTIS